MAPRTSLKHCKDAIPHTHILLPTQQLTRYMEERLQTTSWLASQLGNAVEAFMGEDANGNTGIAMQFRGVDYAPDVPAYGLVVPQQLHAGCL